MEVYKGFFDDMEMVSDIKGVGEGSEKLLGFFVFLIVHAKKISSVFI